MFTLKGLAVKYIQWYSKVEETERGFSTVEPQGKKENENTVREVTEWGRPKCALMFSFIAI